MKNVIIVVPNGKVNLASITGTYQILNRAHDQWVRIGHKPLLRVQLAGFEPELKLDGGLFSIHPIKIADVKRADLIIIPSLNHDYHQILHANKELVDWIREQYKLGSEIASICTGAFLVAATGLLDGKACSTHWSAAHEFRRLFPSVNLQIDKLIMAEPGIYTNGGAYSFLNLALFLVEKYFDRECALYCAKVFQIEIDRSSQSPFHVFQAQKNHGDELVGKAQRYIEDNLNGKISFEALAAELAISRRSFDRRFIKATGNTPVEYWQRVKVEVAKSALEKGRKSVFEVMQSVGYTDDKSFREVFKKITGLSPLDYRTKFSRAN